MRYLGSFFIAFILYLSVFAILFYTQNNFSSSNPKIIQKEEIVKISLIEPQIKQSSEKEIKEVIKKPEKELKKEILKKVEKPKIVKKEIKKRPETKKTVKEKISQPTKIEAKQSSTAKKMQNKKNDVPFVNTTIIKEQFFTLIKTKINNNKEYPKSARRRRIEGIVKVNFQIQRDGNIKNLQIEQGKKIFHKAVINAIKNSFPVKTPKELNSFPMLIKLELKFNLS